MTRLHTLNDLISALCLGVAGVGVIGFGMAFVDVDIDGRTGARRVARSVLQVAVHAGHDFNRAAVAGRRAAHEARAQAAWTLAALLILTVPTGGTR